MGMMDMMGGEQMPQQTQMPQGGMMSGGGMPEGGTPPDESILNEMQSLAQNPAPEAVQAFAQKLLQSDNPAAQQFAQQLTSVINDPAMIVQLISKAIPAIRNKMQRGM